MVALLERYPLLTVGCGQTDGGEVRVVLWLPDGVKLIGKFRIVWDTKSSGKWYDIAWLNAFWTTKHPELGDRSLRELIFEYRIRAVALDCWGADVIALDDGGRPLAALNYPTALQSAKVKDYIAGIPADWWHTKLNGAAQAGYQPLGIIRHMLDVLPEGFWDSVRSIVPVTDYLFWLATGQRGHDPTMAQSMGLFGRPPYEDYMDPRIPPGVICPWEVWATDFIHRGKGGTYFAPFTHDSPCARVVAFSGGNRFAVWTGSWIGVAAQAGEKLVPCEATRQAGLSFEGLRPRAVQRNTSMAGPVYKALCAQLGGYGLADEVALQEQDVPTLSPERFAELNVTEALRYVREAVTTTGGDWIRRGVAAVVKTAVTAVYDDLRKLATVTGEPLSQVAIVGGWANNRAFCERLAACGIEIVRPSHAANATEYGLAADTLQRITAAEGEPLSVQEILAELPTLES